MNLQFSDAKVGDAEAVASLVNSGYRGDSSRRGWTTEAHLLGGQRTDAAKIREMILEKGAVVMMAFKQENQDLIGCVFLKRENEITGYLGMLTVDPNLQTGGVGKAILAESERRVRAWGCIILRMVVLRQRSELIEFYERRGYRKTGVTEPFPVNDPSFGIPKVEGLRLDEMQKLLA